MHPNAARWRNVKVGLAWSFWLANLVIIIGFWFNGNSELLNSGQVGGVAVAIAKLAGFLATFCALTQFVLMGRQGWLEPIFGLDRLAVFHRRNGIATLSLLFAHPSLLAIGYSMLADISLVDQYLQFATMPYVLLAVLGFTTLLVTVGSSIYIVRKNLKFELWHAVHLANYAAVLLFAWHQFINGTNLLVNEWFWDYWLSLYMFAGLNIIIWRWIKPFAQSYRHDFRVQKVVAETPTANSVYIAGRNVERIKAKGGQFIMVRFLTEELKWQEHPFSISMLPVGGDLRITVRALGDFTNQMPNLKKGTRVIVSGPHGAFTHDKQVTKRVLYIAGGIGITPIRSMIEELSFTKEPSDAVLIYGNRTLADTALLGELEVLGEKIKMPIHNVLSEQPGYKGEHGFVDDEKIKRLVPDVAKRDIFLCGPPPMMRGIIAALKQMGVPKNQIHYERFSLHK